MTIQEQLRERAADFRDDERCRIDRLDVDGAAWPRDNAERLEAAADRIDTLEAALREIRSTVAAGSVPEQCGCRECQADVIAREALESTP